MVTLHLLPASVRDQYECHEWRNGAAILREAHPNEWQDVVDMLDQFKLSKSWIVKAGGNKSKIAKWVDEFLRGRGWAEEGFETAISVDGDRRDSPTHKVDCFKNGVGLEVEWNNKDPLTTGTSITSGCCSNFEWWRSGSCSPAAMTSRTFSMTSGEGKATACPRPTCPSSFRGSKGAVAEAVRYSCSVFPGAFTTPIREERNVT